jgi:hypothetical protein
VVGLVLAVGLVLVVGLVLAFGLVLVVGLLDTFRPVGLGDFDGVGFLVGTTVLLGARPPTLLPVCDAVADAPVLRPPDGDAVWVGATELCELFAVLFPLLEISTAMIATMPIAAAPIPANRKVRDPLPRGGGIS